ncbi:MAG: vWA domain-containing protein [Phycisphaerae bacterium]
MTIAIPSPCGRNASRTLGLLLLLFGRLRSYLSRAFGFAPDDQPPPAPASRGNGRCCALVLDVSGSMLETDWPPSRLQAAQDAAQAFCDRLADESPNVQVTIIAYGEEAVLLCPLTLAFDHDTLSRAIYTAPVLNATNITAGLKMAYGALVRSHRPADVVLLTDGHHNHGPGPRQIAARLKGFATLHITGIAGSPVDLDESLLVDIASARLDGSKRYRWIGDRDDLIEHFRDIAGGITRS